MQQDWARDKLQAELRASEAGVEAAALATQLRDEAAALAAKLGAEADELKREAAMLAAELSGEAAELAEEVRGLRERNSTLREAEVEAAERVVRLEAGVATALSAVDAEVRRAGAESEAARLLLVVELRGCEAQLRGSEAEAAALTRRLGEPNPDPNPNP